MLCPVANVLGRRYSDPKELRVIYVDKPSSDAAILKGIFGSHVEVKRDIFHVLNEYYKMMYKHPLRYIHEARSSK